MTTIAEQLLIRPHSTVWLNEPARMPLLTPMPEGVRETGTLVTAGTAVLFVESADHIREQLVEHRAHLDEPGAVWLAYSKAKTDEINDDAIGPVLADFDMRPGEQVAIDERWLALRIQLNEPGGAG